MKKGWLFRVASHPRWGGGHVRRCLAIAQALSPYSPVQFMLDAGGDAWKPHLIQAGMAVHENDDEDASYHAVLLDSYEDGQIDYWRERAELLVVIHDLDDPPGKADLSICQWREEINQGNGYILSGLEYALINPAYRAIEDSGDTEEAEHILIAFGMVDSSNSTGRALDSLKRLSAQGWHPDVTIVMGQAAPHLPSISKAVDAFEGRARLIVDAPDLIDALTECDMAIGAGGVSAVERAAAGRASITVSISANQVPVANALAQRGATIDLGMASSLTPGLLDEAIIGLAQDRRQRAAMAQAGKKSIDGRGPERVAQAMKVLEEERIHG